MELLVKRRPSLDIASEVERLLKNSAFDRYARHAGVHSIVQELYLAYLLYSMHIIGPKESLPVKQALLDTLTERWKND